MDDQLMYLILFCKKFYFYLDLFVKVYTNYEQIHTRL